MPNYDFIIQNEKIIRDFFTNKSYSQRKHIRFGEQIVTALYNEKNIKALANNEQFCEQIAKAFFHDDIINLFGGYRNLLSLPVVPLTASSYWKLGKYIRLADDFMQKNVPIALAMESGGRPIIGIRCIDPEGKRPESIISIHAYYSNKHEFNVLGDWGGHWAVGWSSLTSSVFNSKRIHHEIDPYFPAGKSTEAYGKITYLDALQQLIRGDAFTDQTGPVRCLYYATRDQRYDDAATRIQSLFKGYRQHRAYTEFQTYQNEIREYRQQILDQLDAESASVVIQHSP